MSDQTSLKLGVKLGLKVGLAGAFAGTGALALLTGARRLLGGPRVHILGFHRVVDDMAKLGGEVIPALCITTSAFDRILQLAQKRFEVLSLAEAVAALAGRRKLDRDALVITFDDGYRDVYLRALPVLQKHKLPATVFVPSGFIGSPEPLLHDRLHALFTRVEREGRRLDGAPAPRLLRRTMVLAETLIRDRGPAAALGHLIDSQPAQVLRHLAEAIEDLSGDTVTIDEGARVMSADELRACSDGGIEVGAHTVDHVVLVRESAARVLHELSRPTAEIESITGRPCESFAYCKGLWTPALLPALRSAGYTTAVTTTDRPNLPGCDPLLLGRKVLWEGHTSGLGGGFSTALVQAHLHDLFGTIGLIRPLEGMRARPEEMIAWRRSA